MKKLQQADIDVMPDGLDEPLLSVFDDLPAVAAISEAELVAIETYLSDILDIVLGSSSITPAASLRHKSLT